MENLVVHIITTNVAFDFVSLLVALMLFPFYINTGS